MKKLLVLSAMLLTVACADFDITKYTTADANASIKTRMRACLVSEANTKFQNGTLFASTISATSDEMVSTCTKKLACESAGISSESQTMASNIIQNLQNMSK